MSRRWATAAVVSVLLSVMVTVPVAAADHDRDGLLDSFELRFGLTSPENPDSDGDGVIDSAEDSDGDRLSDRGEQRFGSDPSVADSDGDGIPDGAEDADGDGRSNARQQDQRPVPPALRPSLAEAGEDTQPSRQECQTWHGQSKVTTCSFGVEESDTSIVLAGDSHATMYLTPLKRIAKANGWHLTTMTKSACPALQGLQGNNQWEIDKGRTCRMWQDNIMKRWQDHPPDLVVLAHTPGYKLRRIDGKLVAPWRRAGEWRRALKRTMEQMPASTTVLALGGTPRNFGGNPVNCLRANPNDISACVSPQQPDEKRSMDLGLKEAASVTEAIYDSLYGQICSYDPCPLVQGDILMWRDGSHLSETFARKLRPSLERVLTDALSAEAAS